MHEAASGASVPGEEKITKHDAIPICNVVLLLLVSFCPYWVGLKKG